MAHVTVLGAGLVASPVIRHILQASEHELTVAARSIENAKALNAGHPRGRVLHFDTEDNKALDELVAQSDLVISLLPYTHHVTVAERCIAHKKHLVTTSYVSPAMRALDASARNAGVTLLNELGLDPGIDHMSAMRVIHHARAQGGEVTAFRSYCGGLPAPEANDNPMGYKFSWSPRGVVLAARNSAKYLLDGAEVNIPGPELFAHPESVTITGAGSFEGYPNRDSVAYKEIYGLTKAHSVFRGTLRNIGHCETWKAMADLGLFDDTVKTYKNPTFRGLIAALTGADPNSTDEALRNAVAHKAKVSVESAPIAKLTWLGLFDQDPLPQETISPLDALVARMVTRMVYQPGERDMVVLQHEFTIEWSNRTEKLCSTLVQFGQPNADTAMARTVGLPAALGALGILDGKITRRGVVVPVEEEVYSPILDALEALGVRFIETRSAV